MKKHILFWSILLSLFSLSQAQSVSITASDTTICNAPYSSSFMLNINGGTPVGIRWRVNNSFWQSGGTDTTLTFFNFINTRNVVEAEVDFGGNLVVASIEIFPGIPPVSLFTQPIIGPASGGPLFVFDGNFDTFPLENTPFQFTWTVSGPNNYSINGTGSSTSFLFQGLAPLIMDSNGVIPIPGIYTLTVETFYDPSCSSIETINFLVADAPQYDITFTQPDCGDNGTLSIELLPWFGRTNLVELRLLYPDRREERLRLDTLAGPITRTNLEEGTYVINITDIESGSFVSDFIFLKDTAILDSVSIGHVGCLDDDFGSIEILTSSSRGNLHYQWSTGDTTSFVDSLSAGNYTVTFTDGQCSYQRSYEVRADSLRLSASAVAANCNDSDGRIFLSPLSNKSPFTFLWSTGDSIQNIQGLPTGSYSVVVTDSTGCANRLVVNVPERSFCTYEMSGQVFIDTNGNCILDPGEQFIANTAVTLDNSHSVWTDALGKYSFEKDTSNYTIRSDFASNPNVSLATCLPAGAHIINLGEMDTSGLDFPLELIGPSNTVSLQVTNSFIRPGFQHNYFIHVSNDGVQSVNTSLRMLLDTAVNYISSTPGASYNAATNELDWPINNLVPGENRRFSVIGRISPSVALGTPIGIYAFVDTAFGDDFPSDNLFLGTADVVGSFDPNDKLVNRDTLSPNQRNLTYTIRFQNTGTFPAEFVVIRDTLDTSVLSPQSLKPVGSSHPYSLEVDSAFVTITFNNINLPDSARDLEGSNGYFMFQILTQENLTIGTEINNRAGIYFDFNEPIITNFAKTRIDIATRLNEELETKTRIFPNPSNGLIFIEGNQSAVINTQVFDLQGRRVYTTATKSSSLDLSGIEKGIYLIELTTSSGSIWKKVILN